MTDPPARGSPMTLTASQVSLVPEARGRDRRPR